jgi:AcrR family transcriptional regulator
MAADEPGEGLRARKKRETRARISDTAMRLFLERGFDQVTVAEVAAAADVSEKTVFNYFATKEELVLDLDADREAAWVAAVTSIPGGTPLAGLRAHVLLRTTSMPTGPAAAFRAVIAGSTLLQARGARMRTRHEAAVTRALSGHLGTRRTDPTPAIIAHQVLAIPPLASRMAQEELAGGAAPSLVVTRVRRLVNRAFDILERGLTPTS